MCFNCESSKSVGERDCATSESSLNRFSRSKDSMDKIFGAAFYAKALSSSILEIWVPRNSQDCIELKEEIHVSASICANGRMAVVSSRYENRAWNLWISRPRSILFKLFNLFVSFHSFHDSYQMMQYVMPDRVLSFALRVGSWQLGHLCFFFRFNLRDDWRHLLKTS